MNSYLTHPSDAISECMKRIYLRKLTSTSGGNISILDYRDVLWITPGGTDKAMIEPHMIASAQYNSCFTPGESLDWNGQFRPSTEWPLHCAVYKERSDIKSIIHAHAPALVTFAVAGSSPPTNFIHSSWSICGPVEFSPYAIPGSQQLADNVARSFRASKVNCVLLESHGVVIGATNIEQAFEIFETLEATARTWLKIKAFLSAFPVAKAIVLSKLDESQIQPAKNNLHMSNFDSTDMKTWRDSQMRLAESRKRSHLDRVPCSKEKMLRKQIIDFCHRAYDQGIILSTSGSFSARVDNTLVLITPHGLDRKYLNVHQLVLVEITDDSDEGEISYSVVSRSAYGVDDVLRPSLSILNHLAVYQRHSNVHSILVGHPVNTMVFCGLKGVHFDSRLIPESYVTLQNVSHISLREAFTKPQTFAQCFDDMIENGRKVKTSTVLIESEGAMVVGRSILDAFEKMEVLESMCEISLNAISIGGHLRLMSSEAIDRVHQEFLS